MLNPAGQLAFTAVLPCDCVSGMDGDHMACDASDMRLYLRHGQGVTILVFVDDWQDEFLKNSYLMMHRLFIQLLVEP